MTPNYLNSPPSPFPVNDQQHELYSTKPHDHAASSSSLPNSHAFTYSNEDHQEGYHQSAVNHLMYQQANNLAPQGGSCDHPMPECESSRTPGIKFFLWKKEDGNEKNQGGTQKGSSSAKWMSSKIRLMGKIIKSDRVATEAPTSAAHELKFEDHDRKDQSTSPLETHDHHNSCNSSTGNINTPIRVCSDCNTTKTPLWRSGPRGPKSLCNACGIRQRKARRAMAAATAAAANGMVVAAHEASVVKSKVQHKEKKSRNSHVAPYKKRFKFAATSDQGIRKKLCFEDLLISLGKNLASQSVFPQDEKEAALLLMALSCGLVHG